MKKHISLLFATALFIFSTQHVFAQSVPDSVQKASPEQLAVMQANYLKGELSLTTAEYPKVVDLFTKYNRKMDETMKSNLLVSSKINMVREAEADKEAQLLKILTPEQGKQFNGIKTEFKAKFKQKPKMSN